MATITLKCKSVDSVIPPMQSISSNTIPMAGVNYPNVLEMGGNTQGYTEQLNLNIYDMTYGVYPPMNYSRSQIDGFLITEVGGYSPTFVEVPLQETNYLLYRTLQTTVVYEKLKAGVFIDIDSVFSSIIDVSYGITVASYDFFANDPNFPLTIPNGLYFKYKIKLKNGTYTEQVTYKVYRSGEKAGILRFTEICNINVKPNTINILKFSDFINLLPRKVDANSVGHPMSYFTESVPFIDYVKPQVTTGIPGYVDKIMFLDSTFYGETIFQEDIEIDPRLTYNGVSVKYAQNIPAEGVNNGLLQYNTIGMTEAQINNVKLYVVYTGVLSTYRYMK